MARKSAQKPKRSAAVSKSAADAVAARASLAEITLLNLSANHNIENRRNPPNVFEITLNNNAKFQQLVESGKKVGQRAQIDIAIEILAKHKKEDAEASLSISATYRVLYKIEPGRKFSEQQLSSFASLYTAPVVWPYLSEFVQTTTLKMGLPVLRMPPYETGVLVYMKSI